MGTIGSRIRERISELNLDLPERRIAADVGMTPDVFSRSLNGKRSFSSIELARVADRLSTSMYWLATGEPDVTQTRIAARHLYDFERGAYKDEKTGDTRQTLENIELAYRQVFGGRNDLPIETASPSEIRGRLGNDFVADFAARVQERLDIDVIRVEGIESAYSLKVGGRYCIVVPRSGNWFRQNSSIAHELGHIFLGDFNAQDEGAGEDKEIPAFSFAAQLLLPEEQLRAIDWDNFGELHALNFIWAQGVSTKYLQYRLLKLGIPTSPAVKDLLELSTFSAMHKPVPGKRFDSLSIAARTAQAAERLFPSSLVAAHMEAVEGDKAPKETLAWMLDVDPDQIEIQAPKPSTIDLDDLAATLGLAART